ncbi:hypothetical protein Q4511_14905 [Paracoccus sp. 1_MG-2023]|uniref:hypothetical protein n=1 Tax=unclassified Paracoccus (in: a-proteobacteria) TaxID=2688777 RepID=UPI001C09FEAA|nr:MULTISPECIES: hypothetical protein [unclassified Paracoccus (in: a-proteobacteria)]MBU2956829.1 hypothetical protein [Paracoccus sp. C2R09]MDO6670214.1 hypothetical protein [Paracoccus sp. 1_MG-2023]
MVKRLDQLTQLERIARIKAERQLKTYAAFAAHVTAAQNRIEAARESLRQSYDTTAPLTLPEARTANAQAGRSARELAHADQELQRMLPRFEVVRQQAAREFGRAQVLADLARSEADRLRGPRY